MNREEDEILTACALRFDGYRYCQQTGFDHHALLQHCIDTVDTIDTLDSAPTTDTSQFPAVLEEQLTLFFMLQRYLMKWGGERESKNGRAWRAFRALFLRVHAYPIPAAFRLDEFHDKWEQNYRPRLPDCIRIISDAQNGNTKA